MFELRPDARLRAEFSPAKDAVLGLHAKAMVADREVVYMGTFNLDQRSAVWNSEVALIIHSPELAGQVANSIARDMQPENSWEVVRDASGYTVWLDRGGDEEVRHSSTPQASFGRRMRAGFASLFPIEGQL